MRSRTGATWSARPCSSPPSSCASPAAAASSPARSRHGGRRNEAWRQPGRGAFEPALADPEVQRLVEQARLVGRAATAGRILDALRTGWTRGIDAGLEHEARLFAEAVVDPQGGKAGIRAFIDKQSAPLPTRRDRLPSHDAGQRAGRARRTAAASAARSSRASRRCRPGSTATRSSRTRSTGALAHGLPKDCEKQILLPVPEPGPNEARGLRARLRGELQRHLGHHRHPGVAVREPRSRLPGHRLRRRRPGGRARQRGQARGAAEDRRSGHDLQRPERAAVAARGARPDVRRLLDPGLRDRHRQPPAVPARAGAAAAPGAAAT